MSREDEIAAHGADVAARIRSSDHIVFLMLLWLTSFFECWEEPGCMLRSSARRSKRRKMSRSSRRAYDVEYGYLDESIQCPPPLDAPRELKANHYVYMHVCTYVYAYLCMHVSCISYINAFLLICLLFRSNKLSRSHEDCEKAAHKSLLCFHFVIRSATEV